MTASRPTTARHSQPNQSSNVLAKRTRGPINKRACQRCRQGKIKCDGDAESGKACSNCDPQHCKYDNSPRKNKQVELLKHRLTEVEVHLEAITRDIGEKLTIKDLEKEILCMLYESKEHFSSPQLFQELKDAIKQSRCIKPVLVITYELLTRLPDPKNVDYIPSIMQSLQRFVDCANTYEKDASISTTSSSNELMNRIEENVQPCVQTFDSHLPVVSPMMFPISSTLNNSDDQVEIVVLHPSSDESECFHGTNNVSHHVNQSSILTTSAPEYPGFPFTAYSYYPYFDYLDETNATSPEFN
ncbi:19371_t:CDS:2 [Funneliformis geosporum]|uniref:15316_t:CDS:1 n=1 Tax=Funneliformis geosporum TaxID=1117311 RepID=A0A9W4SCJ8_9GLOM|nr:19371_t:CDS:2 [Funneliformis geosporum]CAI2164751.1 15316_t:CDS:2 [Funneliformis geosporum]